MEAKVNNTEEQRKIRKSEMTLVIVGTGIMMFGAWAAIKVFSMILLRTNETVAEMRELMFYENPYTDKEIMITIIILAALYVLIELGVRVFVGRAAIAEGRGARSGRLYIVFAFMLILAALLSVLFDLGVMINDFTGDSGTGELTRRSAGTSFVIDLTSLVMMIEMMAAAFRVKRYRKKMKKTEDAHAA